MKKSHRNLTVYNLQIIFKHKIALVNGFQLMIYQFHLKMSRRSQQSVETARDGAILHIGFGFSVFQTKKLAQMMFFVLILTTFMKL